MTVEQETQEDSTPEESTVNQQLGSTIRKIRRSKGLSLQQVEANSEHRFKASVLGAYERGERSMSVARVVALAEEYGLPVWNLLPAFMVDTSLVAVPAALKIDIEGDIDLVVTRNGEPRQVIRG